MFASEQERLQVRANYDAGLDEIRRANLARAALEASNVSETTDNILKTLIGDDKLTVAERRIVRGTL